ncbi:hypothetical protein LTR56_014653 [Elasticomyces elasticus]|nr:hypothetical protein LTR56_014653 [Elasticomyces elasticus]KAK3645330.1 hypothetical protein LTR22_014795 [Elasticomyces elasticus]KAK4919829.1 hypothetical protein LTR49_012576 [Elasticomyces elasticus]KAK5750101.1 hypothetical protein LTS12_019827 [Elasticomyces elasticus]
MENTTAAILEDFHKVLSSPELVEKWNEDRPKDFSQEDSDYEDQDGLFHLVLDTRGTYFNEIYASAEGLGALPKTAELIRQSFKSITACSGSFESELRTGLRCGRTLLLATTAKESEYEENYPQFLAGWDPLEAYSLPKADNLVAEVEEKVQERWDNANVDIEVLGCGGSLEGWFGIIRGLLLPTDWLSLYRAQPRAMYAGPGRDASETEGARILKEIELQLFNTSKYYHACEYMTVVTYGDGPLGTISIYRVSLEPGEKARAAQMTSLAYADSVPKRILKGLCVDHRIEYVVKGRRIRCLNKESRVCHPQSVLLLEISTPEVVR